MTIFHEHCEEHKDSHMTCLCDKKHCPDCAHKITWFDEVGFFAYRRWHEIDMFFRNLHWAWQRAVRGWDDCSTWCMRDWVRDNLPAMLRHQVKYGIGHPLDHTAESWDELRLKIADGIEKTPHLDFTCDCYKNEHGLKDKKIRDVHDSEEEKEMKQVMAALHLFADHVFDLWD